MKKILVVLLVLLPLWACVPASRQPSTEQIVWRSLRQGKEEAVKVNKPVLVDYFTHQECPRCQNLVKYVYSDPAIVARINRDFVPVRVDLDRPLSDEEKALADRLESGKECVLAFLTVQGEIVTDPQRKNICTMDMITPESFTRYLDAALDNINKR